MLSFERYASVSAAADHGWMAYKKACDVIEGINMTSGWVHSGDVHKEVQNLPRRAYSQTVQSVTCILNKLADCGEVQRIKVKVERVIAMPDGIFLSLGPEMRRNKFSKERVPVTVSLYRKQED